MASNEQAIEVELPIEKVFHQWTQFEAFPRFMVGIHEVTPLDNTLLRWQADQDGQQHTWETEITEQTPDTRLVWNATEGPAYTYAVHLEPIGGSPRTRVTIQVEYETDAAERVAGDIAGGVARRISSDLHQFKSYIEGRPPQSGDPIRGQVESGNSIGHDEQVDGEDIGTVQRDGDPQVVRGGNTSGLTGDTVNGLGGAPDRGVENGMDDAVLDSKDTE